MLLHRILERTRLLAAEALAASRRCFARDPRIKRQIEATALESRVLFSASPILEVMPESLEAFHEFDQADVAAMQELKKVSQQPTDVDPNVTLRNAVQESTGRIDDSTATTSMPALELVFVDAGVEDAETLLEGLQERNHQTTQWLVVHLSSNEDGVEQISRTLSQLNGIDAIHIVSHGDGRGIQLGSTRLDVDAAIGYAGDIASWSSSLDPHADLLIYGCELASTHEGRALIDSIGALCDCDVAASDNLTGHESLGGDWNLEYSVGEIETETAFLMDVQAQWKHLLDLTVDGGETLVNSVSAGTQLTTIYGGDNVAMDANGNYVVVWDDDRGGNFDVYAQVFNADGSARTGEILVNTYTTNRQEYAAVAMDADGDFVVSWSSNLQDGSDYGVYFQRFDSLGVAQGSETRVNTLTTGQQDLASIGMADDGSFVISFSNLNVTSGDIYAQRYSSSGTAIGSNFRVNTTTIQAQWYSSVDVDSDGDFVIVWESNVQDGSGYGIYGQRYDSSGIAQGSEFRVNSTTAGNQLGAAVDLAADGSFVVAWDSAGQDGSGLGVFAQRYNASGVAQGGEIQVNTYIAGDQDTASIDVTTDGRFAISWQSNAQDGDLEGIFAQEFDAGGNKVGVEVQVNSTTSGNQEFSSIAFANSNVVLVWGGNGVGDSAGVFTQQFDTGPDIARGLFLHHTFDSDASDSSGNNYDGTLTNGASINTTSGTNQIGGGKLSLDGSNDYVDFSSHVTNFQGLTEGTIAVWVYHDVNSRDVIFETSDSGDSDSRVALFRDSDGSFDFYVREGSTTLVDARTAAGVIPQSTWTHVAVTVDASGHKLFVDGAEQGGLTYAAGSSTTNVFFDDVPNLDFGSWGVDKYDGSSFTRYFDGFLDDGRVYDRALSNADISELYQVSALNSGLVAHYEFEDGSGTTATDSTTNANDGVLAGNAAFVNGTIGDGIDFSPDTSGTSVMTIADDVALDFGSGDFTISFWAYTPAGGPTSTLLADGSSGNPGQTLTVLTDGRISWNLSDGTNSSSYIVGTTTDQWQLVTLTRKGNIMQTYLDGSPSGGTTTFAGNITNPGDMFVGAFNAGGTLEYDGQIDDLRFYDRAISGAEATQLYALRSSITVDTTADYGSGNAAYGDTSSFAALTADKGTDGLISLREAIDAANNTTGANTIEFDITGTGVHTISLSSLLPEISGQTTIDATTDSSWAANGNAPAIIIDGNGLVGSGLTFGFQSDNSSVSGLVIRDFDGNAITLNGGADNIAIQGNYLGSLEATGDYAGVDDENTGHGIYVASDNNTIGGTSPTTRNVISGNQSNGISMDDTGGFGASGNEVIGNFVGTDVTGTIAIGNGYAGVGVYYGATNNTIGTDLDGTDDALEGNLIVGNASYGVQLWNGDSNTVRGNSIGVDVTEAATLGSTNTGIQLGGGSSSNQIGGTSALAANVIGGSNLSGINLTGSGTINNVIEGNFIGTNSSQTIDLGVAGTGVFIEDDASSNTIGGIGGGEGNVIAYSGSDGVALISSGTTGNEIRGNSIYANAGQGIDLNDDGYTPNDGGVADDADTGPNDLTNTMDLHTVTTTGSFINFTGFYDGVVSQMLDIDFYANSDRDAAGYSQGKRLVGSTTLAVGGTGYYQFNGGMAGVVNEGEWVTIVVTDTLGNTSEFSKAVLATDALGVVVTTAADIVDGDVSDLDALRADVGADGYISLREAMLASNNTVGVESVLFDIATDDPNYSTLTNSYLIQLSGAVLPHLDEAVTVDGTSQWGFDGTPIIDLDGNGLAGHGFQTDSSNLTIRGLAIRNFDGYGIHITGSSTHTIQGNYIGTDIDGVAASANTSGGIYLSSGADSVTIGGTGANEGNLIAFNLGDGVESYDGSQTIQNNVIHSNSGSGILLAAGGSNTVTGNHIGTDAAGTASGLGNSYRGIILDNSGSNQIGGATAADRNVIVASGDDGINLWGVGTTLNLIQGNYIGVDATGNAALGNNADGINIGGGANNNIIGGDRTAGEGNVISGQIGLASDGIEIDNAGADDNKIYGNYIGTNLDGTAVIANARHGVVIYDGVQGTRIGNTGTGQGNIISGNAGSGVAIDGNGKASTSGNYISSNYIGVDASGTGNLGNTVNGVELFGSASNNIIGGEWAGAGNIIAYQSQNGVELVDGSNNAVVRNSIHSNTLLGIELGIGANSSQEFPVLTSAVTTGTHITVPGTLNSSASTNYRIEFYSNTTGDASGYGEGQTLIGVADVTTDGTGSASFSPTFAFGVSEGSAISAIVSRLDGGDGAVETSEFALNVTASTLNVAATDIVFDSETATEVDVNTEGANEQIDPAIAAFDKGGHIVVWVSNGQDGDPSGDYGIYAQRYNADGTTNGSEFLVTSEATDSETNPSVATFSDGGFVVTWQDQISGVRAFTEARVFNSDGTPATADFAVSPSVDGDSEGYQPTVVTLSDTQFAVVWANEIGGATYEVTGQIYDRAGATVGSQFSVGSLLSGSGLFGAQTEIALLDDGGFATIWRTHDGSNTGVRMRVMNANGSARSAEIVLGGDNIADISSLSNGGFVVTYDDAGDLKAAIYDASGVIDVSEFTVNTTSSAARYESTVTRSSNGFVVVWESDNGDGNGSAILAQRFDVSGNKIDGEIVVNETTTGNQQKPEVVETPSGEVIAVWQSDNVDAALTGIVSRVIATGNASVNENAANGTRVAQALGARDPNAPDTVSFALTDNAGGRFAINSTTGEITVANGLLLDYETSTSHNITVEATDSQSNTFTEVLAIQINDLAENVDPVVAFGGGNISYVENASPIFIDATATVADADATDFDGGVLTISVTANGSGSDRIAINNEGMSAGQVGMTTGPNEVYYGGVLIGTWSGSGAPLAITFNTSADATAVEAVAQNITFENLSDAPSTLTRTIQFQLTDGDGGTSTAITKDIDVTAVNDAPSLDNSGFLQLTTITEDDTNNSGNLVSEILTSDSGNPITDADSGAVEGIAVTSLASGNGTWQYDTGSGWTDVGIVSANSALLLRATDSLRFVPDGVDSDTALVTFKAWDQTAGSFGTRVDASTDGGTTAFSNLVESAVISVTAVNDAPVAVNDPGNLAAEVLAGSPVGYWRLGEPSGTTATNLGSLGTSGTYNGPTLAAAGYPASGSDTAADFDGVNDNVDLGTFDVSGTGLTLSAWINADDFDNGDARIISKAESSGANAAEDHWWMLSTQPSGADTVLRFRVKAGGTTNTLVASSGALTAGEWYFASATYDVGTGSMKIFLNGVQVGSRNHTVGGAVSTDATKTVMVGANPNNYGHFDGRIDEVAIFDKALSQSQLQTMFNSGSGGYVVNEDSPLTVSAGDGVLANDTDIENDSLTADLVTGPANMASFTLNADGSFNYTPMANFSGTDTFVYRTFDGTSYSNNATGTINVVAQNDAPVFSNLDGTPTFTEGGAFVVMDGDATVVDPELTAGNDFGGATLTIERAGGANADDDFDSSGIITTTSPNVFYSGSKIGTYVYAAGSLTVTFDPGATATHVNAVLQTTTYANLSNSPPASVTLNWTFNDGNTGAQGAGGELETTGSVTIGITSVNDPPVLGTGVVGAVASYDFESGVTSGISGAPDITVNAPASVSASDGLSGGSGLLFPTGDNDSSTHPVSISSIPDVATSGEFSFAADVRFDAGSGNRFWETVFSFGGGEANNNIWMGRDGLTNDLHVTVYNGSTELGNLVVSNALQGIFGQWHHAAVSLDASGQLELYIDGVLAGSTNVGGVPDYTTWDEHYIGSSNWSADKRFQGAIDNIAIFDSAIDAADAAALAAQAPPGPSAVYVENASFPVVVDSGLTVSDVDSADFDGGTIVVANASGGEASDRLTVRHEGVGAGQLQVSGSNLIIESITVGSFTGGVGPGGDLVVTFNANADAADVQHVARRVAFWSTSQNPSEATRTLEFTVTDGDGGTSATETRQVSVTAVNDAPVLTDTTGTGVASEGNGSFLFDGESLTDVDSADFDGGTLTITVVSTPNAADDTTYVANVGGVTTFGSNIRVGGITVGSFTGGGAGGTPFVFTFNSNATVARTESVLRAVAIGNYSQDPVAGIRTIEAVLTDGDGGTSNITSRDINFTAVNDIPVISNLDDNPTFVEDGAAVVLDADVEITDPELSAIDNFDGASLTLGRNGGANSDDLYSATGTLVALTQGANNLVVGATTIGSVTQNSGGTLVLTFNSNATNALVNQTMQQIAYSNSSDSPPASVQIDWTFDDENSGAQGAGGALQATGSTTVDIVDAPEGASLTVPIAQSVNEDTVLTFSSAGGNAIVIDSGSSNDPIVAATLSVANGTLTLATTTGITFLDTTSNGDAALSIAGTESDINTALDGLQFQGNQDYNGSDTLTVSTGSPASTEANLYARYEFLGGAVTDQSGNGYDGTITGNPALTSDAERGDGMTFDGDDRIDVVSGVSTLGDEVTIAAWVNLDAGQQDNIFLSLGDEIYIILDNSNPSLSMGLHVNGFTTSSLNSTHNIAGEGWHHVAATINDVTKETSLYLNGELVRSSTFAFSDIDWGTAASPNITIGSLSDGSNAFTGSLDDVRVYDSELTQTAIAAVMGDHGYDSESVNITVDPVNDAPTFSTTNSTPTFTENGGAVGIFSGTGIDAIESGDLIEQLVVTVASMNPADGSDDVLVVDGQSIELTHLNSVTTSTNGYTVNVSVSGGSATVTITKAGDYTATEAEALVDGLAYNNTSEDPQGAVRLITLFSIKDDGGTVNGGDDTTSIAIASLVSLQSRNDAPVLDSAGFLQLTTITENETNNVGNLVSEILASDGGDPITDADSGAVEGIAIVGLTSGNGIWQYDTGSGWTAVGTVSANSALLLRATDSLRFVPDGVDSDTGIVTFKAWDQTTGTFGVKADASTAGGTTAFSNTVESAAISVTAVNDQAIVDLNGADGSGNDFATTFTEGGGAVNVADTDSTISDVDNTTYQGLGINLQSGFVDGSDEKITIAGYSFSSGVTESVVRTVGITDFEVDFDGSGFTITRDVSGTMPQPDLQTLLRGISYDNTSGNPSSGNRTIEIAAEDADLLNGLTSTSTIMVAGTNDAPAIANLGGDTLGYTEGAGAVVIEQGGNAVVSDVDSSNFDTGTLTVRFAAGSDSAEDVLSIRNQGTSAGQTGISGSDVTFGGTIIGTFTGGTSSADLVITFNVNATSVAVTQVVQNVTYENTDTLNATVGARTVDYVVTDGDGGTSLTHSAIVNVGGSNDAPVISSAVGGGTHNEGTPGSFFNNGLTIADADSADFQGGVMTVAITANGETTDRLTVLDGGNVTLVGNSVRYDFGGGPVEVGLLSGGNGSGSPLTITFDTDANLTAAQAVGQRIVFRAETDDPSDAQRTLTMVVTDGDGGTSNTVTRAMNVIAHNDAPIDNNAGSFPTDVSVTEDALSNIDLSSIDLQDVDDRGLDITIKLTTSTGGNLYAASVSGVTVTGDGTGGLTLTGSQDDLNAFLNTASNIQYQHGTANVFGDNADTLSVVFNDNGNYSTSGATGVDQNIGTANVDITNINDAAVIDLDADNSSGVADPNFANSFTEDGSPVLVVDSDAVLSDIDDTHLESLTVTIAAIPDGLAETLAADTTGTSITANYNSGTAVLLLSGTDTVANYLQVLRTVSYDNSSQDPDTSVRSLTIVANDGDITSNTAIAIIQVFAQNDEQVLVDKNVATVAEGSTGNIITTALLRTTDVDNTTVQLTYTVDSLPANGTLFRNGVALAANDTFTQADIDGNLIGYDHDGSDTSNDSFNFTVDDGSGIATSDTFAWIVTNSNDVPIMPADTGVNVAENTTAVGTFAGTDPDSGDTLTYSLTGADAAGFSIDSTTGEVTFLAAPNFELPGDASGDNIYDLTVVATDDGTGNLTDSQNVTVTVMDVNEAPTAILPSGVSVNENINTTGGLSLANLVSTDEDLVETFTYAILPGGEGVLFAIGGASGDELILDDGVLDFERNAIYTVYIRVTDSGSNTFTTDLTVNVADTNDPPAILTNRLVAEENQLIAGVVQAVDEDLPADLLTWSLTNVGVDNGLFAIDSVTGQLTFNTLPDFEAPDDADRDNIYQLDVHIDDGTSSSTMAVSVTVANVNEGPVNTIPGSQTTNSNTPLLFSSSNGNAISITDIDAGTQPVTVTLSATHGTLTLNSTTGVTFVSGDGTANQMMTFVGTTDQINNAMEGLRFDPFLNYSGTATIQITTDDGGHVGIGGALIDSDRIDVIVNVVNNVPVAISDVYHVEENATLFVDSPGVLANDTDSDGELLTASLLAGTIHGTLSLRADGSFVYAPDADFFGVDTFTYVASDGVATSGAVSVTLVVQPIVAPPPVNGDVPTPDDPNNDDPTDDDLPQDVPEVPPAVPIDEPQSNNVPVSRSVPAIDTPAETKRPPAVRETNAEEEMPTQQVLVRIPSRPVLEQRTANRDATAQVAGTRSGPSSTFETSALFTTMDAIAEEVANESLTFELIAGTSMVVTGTFSAGYLLWTARAGYLLTLLSSSLPAWAGFDPIPVLDAAALGRKRERELTLLNAESLIDIAKGQKR